MRMGPDGYAIERNTRYPDHKDGNDQMFSNLVGGKELNGWQLRKIMEEHADYDSATAAIAAAPYVSTEYATEYAIVPYVLCVCAPFTNGELETWIQCYGQLSC